MLFGEEVATQTPTSILSALIVAFGSFVALIIWIVKLLLGTTIPKLQEGFHAEAEKDRLARAAELAAERADRKEEARKLQESHDREAAKQHQMWRDEMIATRQAVVGMQVAIKEVLDLIGKLGNAMDDNHQLHLQSVASMREMIAEMKSMARA